jgi:hypothetical protein
VSVAVWCSNASANPTSLAHQVVDLLIPRQSVTAAGATATHVDVPQAELARWAATYRDPHTDQTMTLSVSGSALSTGAGRGGRGGAVFVPDGAGHFRGPQGEAVFQGVMGRRSFILVRTGADTARYEEVRATPASVPLSDYTGTYGSDELDVRFVIALRDGNLVIRRRPADEFELRPVYADDFQSGGGLGTLRFARDANGKVTGFSFYAGRVLDVRFKRVN